MMKVLEIILPILGYFFGAIPFGLIVSRAKNVDIRKIGSGNIGATNVARALGWKYGAFVFLLDALKGFMPVYIAGILTGNIFVQIITALSAFVGHIFSIYLKLRGGKGVATAFGVILGTNPIIALILLGVWIIAVAISRISAIGALSAALTIIILSFFWDTGCRWENISWVIIGGAIYFTHRDNIKKLIRGEEKEEHTHT